MYIKEIRLKNFLSYGECRVEFSPGVNAIYGLNGSGKSNILRAVEYVLSRSFLKVQSIADLYRDVIYVSNNAGSSRPSGSEVMVVVDNSDRRIPGIDKDLVSFKREFRANSDNFYVEGKLVQKKDMEGYLESAGLSGKNPYFIVRQGTITQLADATPIGRYKVLKDLAGFSYYDDKKKLVIEDLDKNEKEERDINTTLESVQKDLSKLEKANSDYSEFKKLLREMTACNFALESSRLRLLEAGQIKEKVKIKEAAALVEKKEEEIKKIETKSAEFKRHIERRQTDHETNKRRLEKSGDERDELSSELAKNEIRLASLNEEKELKSRETEGQLKAETKAAEASLAEIEAEKGEIGKNVGDLKKKEAEMESKLNELRRSQEAAVNRKALTDKFAGKKTEKDAFLRKKIAELELIGGGSFEQIRLISAAVAEAKTALNQKNITRDELVLDKVSCQDNLGALRKKHESIESRYLESKSSLAKLTKELESKESEVETAKTTLNRFDLATLMPRHVKAGYESMKIILAELEEEAKSNEGEARDGDFDAAGLLAAYHGLLIDHVLPLDDSYITAIEVVAGSKLWHFVVDDADVATEILQRHKRSQRRGEINFMPIAELISDPDKRQPVDERWIELKAPDYSDRAKPALNLIQSNTQGVQAALDFVFGQDIVCGSSSSSSVSASASAMEVACQLKRLTNRQIITLDGDTVERKGAMRGGYIDKRRSKILGWRNFQSTAADLKAAEEAAKEVEAKVRSAENELASAANKYAKSKEILDRQGRRLDQLKTTSTSLEKEVCRMEVALKAEEASLDSARNSAAETERKIKSYERELKRVGDGAVGLSEEEEEEAARIVKEIARIEGPLPVDEGRPSLAVLRDELFRAEKLWNEKSLDFDDRNRKLSQLRKEASERAANDEEVKEIAERIVKLNSVVDANRKRVGEAEKVVDEVTKAIDAFDRDAAGMKEESASLERMEQEAVSSLKDSRESHRGAEEKLQNTSKSLEEIRAEISKMSLELRPEEKLKYPSASSSSSSSSSLKSSVAKLEKTLAELTTRRNGLSFDPLKVTKYKELDEQMEKLLKEKTETRKKKDKLEELLESLEHTKKEAVEDTISRVTSHFKHIFADLVPGGSGDLVPGPVNNRSNNNNNDEAMDEDDRSEDSSVSSSITSSQKRWGPQGRNNFGLDIHASFNDSSIPMKSIASLSGGQKSLVALAFIFALQRVDPAPFYILDEPDAHIDEHYRRTVVNMLRTQSIGAAASPSTSSSSSSSLGAQFIFTAHKKEMVERAESLFRVKMINNQSRILQSDLGEATKYFAKRSRQDAEDDDRTSSGSSPSTPSASGQLTPGDGATPARPSSSEDSLPASSSSLIAASRSISVESS